LITNNKANNKAVSHDAEVNRGSANAIMILGKPTDTTNIVAFGSQSNRLTLTKDASSTAMNQGALVAFNK
jgi:hypothetical protein